MTTVAIVYHSGFGHTQALAEAVAKGAQAVPGTKVSLIPVAEAEAREAELDAADAIVFGSPTYMGGVSAEFAKFKDWTSKRWMVGTWRNKIASGFTVSASWNGDKHNTLYQLLTLALQHGMVWVRRPGPHGPAAGQQPFQGLERGHQPAGRLGRRHGAGPCGPGRRRHRLERLQDLRGAGPACRRGGQPLEGRAAQAGSLM